MAIWLNTNTLEPVERMEYGVEQWFSTRVSSAPLPRDISMYGDSVIITTGECWVEF